MTTTNYSKNNSNEKCKHFNRLYFTCDKATTTTTTSNEKNKETDLNSYYFYDDDDIYLTNANMMSGNEKRAKAKEVDDDDEVDQLLVETLNEWNWKFLKDDDQEDINAISNNNNKNLKDNLLLFYGSESSPSSPPNLVRDQNFLRSKATISLTYNKKANNKTRRNVVLSSLLSRDVNFNLVKKTSNKDKHQTLKKINREKKKKLMFAIKSSSSSKSSLPSKTAAYKSNVNLKVN